MIDAGSPAFLPRIAVILPPREEFRSQRSGAVALIVGDHTRHSRFRDRITIFGGGDSDIADVAFERLAPPGLSHWLQRRSNAYARSFLRRCRSAGFTHVEVQNRPHIFSCLAGALPPDVALCLYLHNDPQEMKGLKSPAERRAVLRRAAAVFCVSDYVRQRFIESVDVSRDKIHIVHGGIDLRALPGAEKEKIILYVGRLIREKGVLDLALALQRIRPALAGWKLLFIGPSGTGSQRDYERQVNETLAVFGENYLRMPFLPHDQVMQAFATAEIAVVPSRWQEPFGRTALEAMAGSAAVVTSGSGGLREIVGDAGIIVDPPEPEALASAILGLVQADGARRSLQARGYARAAEHFDIRVVAARLDALRSEICSSDRAGIVAGG